MVDPIVGFLHFDPMTLKISLSEINLSETTYDANLVSVDQKLAHDITT